MKARTLIKSIAAIVAVALTACSPRHKDKTHMSITGPLTSQSKTAAPCGWIEGQWQFNYPVGSIGKQFEFKRAGNNELALTASFDRAIAVNGKVQDARASEAVKVVAACTESETVKMDVTYANGNTDKMEFQGSPDQTAGTLIISAKRGGDTIGGAQGFQRISPAPVQAKAN